MNVYVKINIGNAAFADHEGIEVARLLHRAARYIEDQMTLEQTHLDHVSLRDINGNNVGKVWLSEE